MSLDSLYTAIQSSCLPALWSRGVSLSRNRAVLTDRMTPDEITLRVAVSDKPVHPKVTLWPEEDDWYCDCGDRNDPCAHVAAAVISLKMAEEQPVALQNTRPAPNQVAYRFTRKDGALEFERVLIKNGKDQPIPGTLVALVGGIQSGRIPGPLPVTSRDDFGVDRVLSETGFSRGKLSPSVTLALFPALEGCAAITLDGKPVKTSRRVLKSTARVFDQAPNIVIKVGFEEEIEEAFSGGAALRADTLYPIQASTVGETIFTPARFPELIDEILPALRRSMTVNMEATRLPTPESISLYVDFRTETLPADQNTETLVITPVLTYGQPPIAELRGDRLDLLQNERIPLRNRMTEGELARRVLSELSLKINHPVKRSGSDAIALLEKIHNWTINSTAFVSGSGAGKFSATATLTPILSGSMESFEAFFKTPDSMNADTAQVLKAWQAGDQFVPLLDGRWAKLPLDWLKRFGPKLEALFSAREASGRIGRARLPELATLLEATGSDCTEELERFKNQLEKHEGIPSAQMPNDLRATLRNYQKTGVDWLTFMREAGLGALLADDMGLGKTLQALCAVKAPALIVCPASVIHSWAEQARSFRPSLGINIYHGTNRKLKLDNDLTITTYGTLRQDATELTATEWKTVILDEAQTIKNPDSQAAMAAHRLRGAFRLALTGTPIENRADDIWSIFQFIAPGLLGSRAEVETNLHRTKAFILRRLKKEVAPELPPRTTVTLDCELSSDERTTYGALMAAGRKEVLERLEKGGGVIEALELLLRLRQACCHQSLLPGIQANSSAKLELLLDSLENSIAASHRSLVFSQWTGFLDLIEKTLKDRGITYSRLDGTTRDRATVVENFQAPNGPSVMLISLKAGGLGLTLTAADHVFIMDPWWNPAVEEQAADRAHRIGQTNPVLIHKLIAKDTVEEKILLLQEKKQELARTVLEGTSNTAGLTSSELLELLN